MQWSIQRLSRWVTDYHHIHHQLMIWRGRWRWRADGWKQLAAPRRLHSWVFAPQFTVHIRICFTLQQMLYFTSESLLHCRICSTPWTVSYLQFTVHIRICFKLQQLLHFTAESLLHTVCRVCSTVPQSYAQCRVLRTDRASVEHNLLQYVQS